MIDKQRKLEAERERIRIREARDKQRLNDIEVELHKVQNNPRNSRSLLIHGNAQSQPGANGNSQAQEIEELPPFSGITANRTATRINKTAAAAR